MEANECKGVETGTIFSTEDILCNRKFPLMKREVLLNNEDCIVIPVRNMKSQFDKHVYSEKISVQ